MEVDLGFMMIVPLIIYGTVIGVSVTYLVVCLRSTNLRRNHGKWFQMAAAAANVAFNTCITMDFVMTYSGKQVMAKVPGLCVIGVPVAWIGDHLFTVCLVLATLERLVSMWRGDSKVAGFTARNTCIVLVVTTGVLTIFVTGLVFGLGGVQVGHSQGLSYCYTGEHSFMALSFLYLPAYFVLLVLTCLMCGRLCKTRFCDAQPYPLHKTLPIIIGNVLMIMAFMVLLSMENWLLYSLDLEPFVHIILFLVWLLAEIDTRGAYCRMCCPCCPQLAPDEAAVELVHA